MNANATTQLKRSSFLIILLISSISFSFGQNPIVAENLLAGTPQSVWDANEGGPIEGFAQEFSVNKGETVHFKINIASSTLVPFTVKIYRVGWYQGNGARFITDLGNSLMGKTQPDYNYEPSTGKVDCTNWSVSAQWAVPNNSSIVSGVYIARFDCPDVDGSSIQLFVVRDDASNSTALFKTCDATWQAYNTYGGNTFYAAATPIPGFTHATKVSYQRPIYIRGDKTSFFNSEYPMIRFLEKNGYNLSYTTDLDFARNATPITPAMHKTILSIGHDEYWSLEQRNKMETARNNGVNIAFFCGNEAYWKTRWEDNYQTLVCYKEGTEGENICGSKCDPLPNVWTGLWRSGCSPAYATNDACRPEGSLSGQMSWAQSFGSIQVPDTYKKLRIWKNTSIAALGAGQSVTFPFGTLGSEWDPEQFTEFYPAHRTVVSRTVQDGKLHKMALYRHSNGALVFSSGTMNWAWGVDDKHDNGNLAANADMQQATINILHDMALDAGSIQSGLVLPTIGPDALAPTTIITSPAHNASLPGSSITITGTSTENGNSAIGGVEVSIDNGTTWHTATGLENWSYTFAATGYGTRTIKVRAWDDYGNVEATGNPGSANCITISFSGPFEYSVFNSTYPTVTPASYAGTPVELGMKFRSAVSGFINGFRYYKAPGITGVHTGHLWSSDGVLLATKVFSNETPSGWQLTTLDVPVAIDANKTYIVSYFSASGDFTKQDPFFTQPLVNGILRGLANGEDGGNGVYEYSNAAIFPGSTSGSSNYFADILFSPANSKEPKVITVTPANSSTDILLNVQPKAILSKTIDPSTVTPSTVIMTDDSNTIIPGSVTLTSDTVITLIPVALAASTHYTITLKGGDNFPAIKDLLGNPLIADYTWSFTSSDPSAPVMITQPVSQTICAYNNISFSSAATGTPIPTVQWQKTINAGLSWINIAGANSAVYSFTSTPANNNDQYRAVWSNSVGTVNSSAATLNVSDAITGYIAAVNSNTCIGSPIELKLAAATGQGPYALLINSVTYPAISVGQAFRPLAASETIWTASSTPQEAIHADNNPVEVGVKFKTNKDGIIKGIRFYKGSNANGGTHIGSLWSQSGALLASVTFVNETSSGWQDAMFASPVNVTANTTYVASYFLPQGNYSKDPSYFSNSYSNGNSLTALQNTATEANAVYSYTSQTAFPDQNFGDPNYWVDVVFAPYITSTTTFALTKITASNGCSLSGNPINSVTVTVSAPVNSGTISGASSLCVNSTTAYTSNGTSGGTWSSSNPAVAAVNPLTGSVTAIATGTTNIIYAFNSGCGSPASSFKTLTVTPEITAGTVSGNTPICVSVITAYTSNGSPGGVWSSSNPSVATVNASGVVTAISAGTTNVTYTVNSNCANNISFQNLRVITNLAPTPTVTGASPLCIGSTSAYTNNGSAGGTWNSSNSLVATVNANGVVTALSAGTTNISYTYTNSCGLVISASKTLTVNPNANAGILSGISPLCLLLGSTTFSSNGDPNGTWSSSNVLVAGVNSSGNVSALLVGTTTITYTVNTGCNSPVSASKVLSVNIIANAGTISGSASICAGNGAAYTSSGDAGGAWKTSNTSIATVNASGVVTGINSGTVTLTYTVKGCIGTASSTKTITVKPAGTCTSFARGEVQEEESNKITDDNKTSEIAAYPNPSTAGFTLILKGYGNEKLTVIVRDLFGKKVYQTEGSNISQLNFGKNFITGIYLLEVLNGTGRQTIKLVKQ